jgi:hypothetical protein
MDDTTIRKILSAGDIADRLMINKLKIEHIPSKAVVIQEENYALEVALRYLADHVDQDMLFSYMQNLLSVLRRQWDLLDRLRDAAISDEERGRCAVEAQDANIERVAWKNKINVLAGSFVEHKQYGKSND